MILPDHGNYKIQPEILKCELLQYRSKRAPIYHVTTSANSEIPKYTGVTVKKAVESMVQ